MTFGDFYFGVVVTAVCLMFFFPFTFQRDHPVLSFLLAACTVVLIVMPVLYLLVYYFGGFV